MRGLAFLDIVREIPLLRHQMEIEGLREDCNYGRVENPDESEKRGYGQGCPTHDLQLKHTR